MNEFARFSQKGNVTNEPVFSPAAHAGGTARCVFDVASNPSYQEKGEWKQGKATFLRVVVFGRLAENAAATLRKGTRVSVSGNIKPNEYEKDGVKVFSFNFTGTELAVDLDWATASVEKNGRSAAPVEASAASSPISEEEPAF
jgi:single-strand DNA-binding protein